MKISRHVCALQSCGNVSSFSLRSFGVIIHESEETVEKGVDKNMDQDTEAIREVII